MSVNSSASSGPSTPTLEGLLALQRARGKLSSEGGALPISGSSAMWKWWALAFFLGVCIWLWVAHARSASSVKDDAAIAELRSQLAADRVASDRRLASLTMDRHRIESQPATQPAAPVPVVYHDPFSDFRLEWVSFNQAGVCYKGSCYVAGINDSFGDLRIISVLSDGVAVQRSGGPGQAPVISIFRVPYPYPFGSAASGGGAPGDSGIGAPPGHGSTGRLAAVGSGNLGAIGSMPTGR